MGMVCNHILGTVSDHPDDSGQPSLGWWETKLWKVGDAAWDGGCPLGCSEKLKMQNLIMATHILLLHGIEKQKKHDFFNFETF